jgi:riboflavin synthase
MFSGIVETKVALLEWVSHGSFVRIKTEKSSNFSNIIIGESIAFDGICLTLEAYDSTSMTFALGPETLKVTGWSENMLRNKKLNVERSLRLGDQIHGHLVNGHVDAMGRVAVAEKHDETLLLQVILPKSLQALVWRKGSVALNGVSLTVNSVKDLANGEAEIEVCLIPETLKRTNLSELKAGDILTVEDDQYARALQRQREVPDADEVHT